MNAKVPMKTVADIHSKKEKGNRFLRLLAELRQTNTGRMTIVGGSMRPIIENGSLLTYQVCHEYQIGDIVFCKVEGRFIDAHRIIDKTKGGSYLIANNLGKENGWTRDVFAKVVHIAPPDKGMNSIHTGSAAE